MHEIHESPQAENSLSPEAPKFKSDAEGGSPDIHSEPLTPVEEHIKKIADSDHPRIEKFKAFDGIVQGGELVFVQMGLALEEINRHELWKEANHKNWDAYCTGLCGISKSHANRLIVSARIAVFLSKQTPAGFERKNMEPRSESQVRPLSRLKKRGQWLDAWCQAVDIASGQPTQEDVASVVREMLGTPSPTLSKKPDTREIVRGLIDRLRILIDEDRPKDELKALLVEIEEAVKSKSKSKSKGEV